MIITLDGPAGSGKSTVAQLLARRLDAAFLDTGAMYRGIAALCLDRQIDPRAQPDRVAELARQADLRFQWSTDPPRLLSHERDLTDQLRRPEVTALVSVIAALGPVRQVLVESQRKISLSHARLVTEGRDQGSVVFPEATIKFYLDASPQQRAKRRADQLRQAGNIADEQKICEQLIARDRMDAERADGPLICPDDAIRLDTSEMSLSQVVNHLYEQVIAKTADPPQKHTPRV